MQRTQAPGATTNNRFTDGDPVLGIAASVLGADWLNAVQEELSTVVEEFGGALSPSKRDQVYQVLRGLQQARSDADAAEARARAQADQALQQADQALTQRIGSLEQLVPQLIQQAKEALYPVGSLYTNANDSNNPATLLGFGTWQAFGQGRVLVGRDVADNDFKNAGATGGEKRHALTAGENGPHNHTGNTSWAGNHSHTYHQRQIKYLSIDNSGAGDPIEDGGTAARQTSTSGNHRHSFTTANSGSGTPHNNLQPYIVVYMWRRTL